MTDVTRPGSDPTPRCLVVAEAGVNHCGSLEIALELVDAAADAGADVVKFQSYRTDLLVRDDAPQADYQRQNARARSQADMLRALELSPESHRAIAERCTVRGIEFLSTAFDPPSLDLVLKLGVSRLKVASGELTNGPMLLRMARTGLPMIVSTGMATLQEVADALAIVAFGRTNTSGVPASERVFEQRERILESGSGLDAVTVLHCTSSYPAPAAAVNLRAMPTLGARFGLPYGYSDHTRGIAVAIAAAALGATVIEKHLTLDRTMSGPDHAASLEPDEMRALVSAVRETTEALGGAEKAPDLVEAGVRAVARRSLHCARALSPEVPVGDGDLVALRPGEGMPPAMVWDWIGRRPARHYEMGELFEG